jgi:NADPH-dependent ferric siderophore reductase
MTATRPRPARIARSATVHRTAWVAPQLVRVVLGGEDLRTMPPLEFTDHYVKLLFPPVGADYRWPFDPDHLRATLPPDQWPVTRTYTIRAFDPVKAEMSIDFVVHGDEGLAGPWAAAAEPGDRIGFFGPGGAYAPDATADHHLLIGDEAAVPAIAVTLERLPVQAVADVFVEVAGPGQEIDLPVTERTCLRHVHRLGRPYGDALVDAVRAHGLPSGALDVFVHGNAEMVRRLRRWLFVEHRVERRRVSISGYWRTGQTEDRWQASKREFNAQMEAEEAVAAAS